MNYVLIVIVITVKIYAVILFVITILFVMLVNVITGFDCCISKLLFYKQEVEEREIRRKLFVPPLIYVRAVDEARRVFCIDIFVSTPNQHFQIFEKKIGETYKELCMEIESAIDIYSSD